MTEDRSPKASEEPAAAAAAESVSRQRKKKRKWDQPAESLISAGIPVPGSLPFGIAGAVGIPLLGAASLSSGFLTNPVPATSSSASLLFQSPSVSQNAAVIVQKLNQPKIQDELIAREIVINDAEPTVRYKLTKRQTQEEIQKCTRAVVITRGKYCPPNGLPDNEKPLYLHISAGAHLKDTAERIKAVDHAASMIEEMLKQSQNSLPASTPFLSALSNGQATQPLSICLYLGFDPDPSLNIAARIRGPNDQYINHIMNETGATVVLRGRGSGNLETSHAEEVQPPMHLYLSSISTKSLESARILAENLLDTICAECGASRISLGKAYGAVPPPQQLLAGVPSTGEKLGVNTNPVTHSLCTAEGSTTYLAPFAPSVAPIAAGSTTCPPGTVQPGGLPFGNPHPNAVSYSRSLVTGGTCYNGYGGIYPRATPLQQVALALRKAPASANSAPASTTTPASTSSKTTSGSNAETEKRPPHRRKFQELPVTSNGPTTFHQNLLQGSEFLKPGPKDLDLRNVSSMPPPKKLVQSLLDGTSPLPPPTKAMPPPPKFQPTKSIPQAETQSPIAKKFSTEPVSDTLLKLVEYGEEEDDDVDASCESPKSNLTQNKSSKPFWAV